MSDSAFADLTGKIACVTGSSSGIGRAIAVELARGGADVIVHCGRNLDGARQTIEQIEALGRRGKVLQCELRDVNGDEFARQAWAQLGRVDILVNNAGADILTGAGPGLSFADKLDTLWQVDVRACLQLSRAMGRRMQEAGSGVILNIGWDQADRGMEGDSAELFSTVKNAVMGYTRSLSLNLAPLVRVNCIAPGWIKTSWGDQASSGWQERVLRETPLKRWGLPEDIARLARFLVSNDASYITGQVINANGGAVR